MPLPFVNNSTDKIMIKYLCLWKGSRRIPPPEESPGQFSSINFPPSESPRLIPLGEFLTLGIDREILQGKILLNSFEKNMI